MNDIQAPETAVRPRKKMNITYVVGIVVILAFVALAIPEFSKSVTPYVTEFSEVRSKHVGETIQVKGELVKNEITYDKSGAMIFFIKDEAGDKLKCRYTGTRPGNLDQAPWIVVVGMYENDVFKASNLICKCPDKYEGQQK